MNSILKVENVEKYYGNKNNLTKALNGVSLEVNASEYVGIMGASGSGKTTLLNCISTIDHVTAGNIYISGENTTSLNAKKLSKFRREHLGFIFQDFNLLDTLTGYENIALPMTILKKSPSQIEEKIKAISTILDIEDCLSKYPTEMSGGQKQRVASARAMVTNPTLVLADEPTGALDSKASKVLLENFANLVSNHGATILMVTHDAFAASHCDRVIFIKDGTLFTQLVRGEQSRKEFFGKILEMLNVLGGDQNDLI